MGFRFRKSFKVAPGVRVNLGKKSASVSIGGKGARFTASTSGRRTSTVGIPGTGLSYSSSSGRAKRTSGKSTGSRLPSARTYKVCGVLMWIIAAVCAVIGLPTVAFGGWIFLLIGAPCALLGRKYLRMSKALSAPEEQEKPEA